MIDLHNHILPGVDDGAADFEESLAIARQFVSEGVTVVAATPHLDPLHNRGLKANGVRGRVEMLRLALREAGVALEIVVGNELFLTPNAPDLVAAGEVAGLNETKFILIEVSLTANERPLYLDETVFRLQLQGVQPILAHPERYAFVQRDVTAVESLRDRGVALQLTAPSLLGEYGGSVRKTAERLLQRGSYMLAASDRHHPGSNRSLRTLYQLLEQRFGSDLADLLLRDNPACVIAGRDPKPPDRKEPATAGFLARLLGRR